MINRALCTTLVLMLACPIFACKQDGVTARRNKLVEVLGKIKVRQAAVEGNVVEEPASFQFVHSGDKSIHDSYAMDIGLTYEEPQLGGWSISPTVEYHRQTETERPQNNFQTGVSTFAFWGDVTETAKFTVVPQAAVKYKWEKYTSGDAFVAKAGFTLLRPSLGIGSLHGSDPFAILWQPTAAIQYESDDDVMETGRSGNLLRATGNLELALYPLATKLKKHVELVCRVAYWHNFERNGAWENAVPEDQRLFSSGLMIFFSEGQHFGIGVEYSNGENPEEGLQTQETTTCTFKMRF